MNGIIGNYWLGLEKTTDKGRRKIQINKYLRKLKNAFGDRLYAEIQLNDLPEQIKLNKYVLRMAKKHGLETIVTMDGHYLKPEEADLQDILICKKWREQLDGDNHCYTTRQLWYKTRKELQASRKQWHSYIPAADLTQYCDNTVRLSDRVEQYNILPDGSPLPIISDTPDEDVLKVCKQHPEYKGMMKQTVYKKRFEEEYNTIKKLGFCNYFLVVWDIAQFSRKSGIAYNARGSVNGSLIAYLMTITWVDPIRFDCPFARFLTEDRLSLPDIDMDFGALSRKSVIEYVENKYGHDCVAHICNYAQWKPKGVVKDVGKVMGYNFQQLNSMTIKIDESEMMIAPNSSYEEYLQTWDAFLNHDEMKNFLEANEDLALNSIKLLGVNSQMGVHASGVVVTPTPLHEWCPVAYSTEKGKGEGLRERVTEWDMYDLEDAGILKLDFLGQNTLDIVSGAIKLINLNHEVPYSTFDELCVFTLKNLNDKKTYDLIARGNNVGLFQLGTSEGMIELSKQIAPTCLEEICVVISLYRTGVLRMGMHTEYVERRNGKEYTYVHPKMGEVLDSTEGILLYQEQCSALAVVLAGFTPTEADHFRKGIKLKDKRKFSAWKKKFVRGCRRKTKIDKNDALEIWKFIEAFSGYGFNKCLSGDTVVERGYKSSKAQSLTIEHLYLTKNNREYAKKNGCLPLHGKLKHNGYGNILSVCSDGRIRPNRIKDIHCNGIKKVYLITLLDGRTVKATAGHRFLTDNGYVTVKNLHVGDILAVNGRCMNSYEYLKDKSPTCNKDKSKSYVGCGFPVGKDNPSYVDGSVAEFKLTKQIMRSIKNCHFCGAQGVRLEHHHTDGNRKNNSLENVVKLCSSCHKIADYAIGKRGKVWDRGRSVEYSEIVSIKYTGKENTYDVEMDTEEHNFLANGVVSHNSHGQAYAFISYMTAYLKANYPAEFMTSVLTHNVDDHKKMSIYLQEIRKMGLKIYNPDINKSSLCFTLHNGGVLYPITAIQKVGEKAANEILVKRNKRYKSLEDFLGRINKRVVNVGVVSNLILAGCFRKYGRKEKIFDMFVKTLDNKTIKQFYCGDCNQRYPVSSTDKKWESSNTVCPMCGSVSVSPDARLCRGKLFNKSYLHDVVFGFAMQDNKLKEFADIIAKEKAEALGTIEGMLEGEFVKVAFEVVDIKKYVDKNDNEMAFLKVADSTAELDVTIFASDWKTLKEEIRKGGCYLGLFKKNRGGLLYSSRNGFLAKLTKVHKKG